MTETVKVFACPKCGLIIDYGVSPCPYCSTTIAWEGFIQPSEEAQNQTDLDLGAANLGGQSYSTPIVEIDYSNPETLASTTPAMSSPSSSYAPKSNDELLLAATTPVLDSVDYANAQAQDAELKLHQQQDQLLLQKEKLKEQQRLLEEEQKRLAEQESLLQEQQRLEQEALIQEQQRIEQERLLQEQLERQKADQERALQEQLEQQRLMTALADEQVEKQRLEAAAATAATAAAAAAATSATMPRGYAPLPDMPPIKDAASPNSRAAAALPDMPPIKNSSSSGTYSAPKRKTKRSAAVVAASVAMKIIAVISWIVAIVFFVAASETVIAALSPFSLETLIDVLASDQKVKIGFSCIIFGFLFFGVGVIIGLLGDIRRGAR